MRKNKNSLTTCQAAILGTRDGDPNASSQKKFCPTDSDWPKMMRVNPILCWKFDDIWNFIRQLNLPYPSLYDRGYTSLGDRKNTRPNPALSVTDEDGKETILSNSFSSSLMIWLNKLEHFSQESFVSLV
jgi:FAD synthetase